MANPRLSVVSPCFNEEENVDTLVERLSAVLEGIGEPWEIVLVDDGSSDGTLEKIRAARERDSRIRYVSFSRNFGHSAAVSAGMAHASGEAVVLIDADLQDPPEVIAEMVARWREGYHVIYGQRGERVGETVLKKATAAAFYRLMAKIIPFYMPLDTGDFRLMSRHVVDTVLALPERVRFARGMVAWTGFLATEVRYQRQPRHAGETKYNVKKMMRFAIDGVTSFSIVPLQLLSTLGAIVTLLSVLGLVGTLAADLIGATIPGYVYFGAGLFVLGGVQLAALGLLGEYLGRNYMESQHRPIYVIAETGGVEPRQI